MIIFGSICIVLALVLSVLGLVVAYNMGFDLTEYDFAIMWIFGTLVLYGLGFGSSLIGIISRLP